MGNDEVQLPWKLSDFLSGAYYAVSISVVLVGLVVWSVHQQGRIDFLIDRDKEHPTKQELAEIAIRVDNRIAILEKGMADVAAKSDLAVLAGKVESLNRHVDDLDTHGTRALVDRVNSLEQGNRTQDERIQELVRRINDMQSEISKISHDMAVFAERQNVNAETIRTLQQRLYQYSGGERGPTSPERAR